MSYCAAFVVSAGATFRYTAIIQDASNPPVPVGSGALKTLTLSITDDVTGGIVNGCDAVDILNTGRGAIDANGNLVITSETGDTQILREGDPSEVRWMTIDFTYPGPAAIMTGRHAVPFTVIAMPGD